jgi:hypothetical protein
MTIIYDIALASYELIRFIIGSLNQIQPIN